MADHADIAIAPVLSGNPGDDVRAVIQLPGGIFVLHQSVGLAIAANVHPDAGIAGAGEMIEGDVVAGAGAAAFAIRQIFQNGGNRLAVAFIGYPDACGKTAAVRHGDPFVLYDRVAVIADIHVTRLCRSIRQPDDRGKRGIGAISRLHTT